MSSYLQTLAFLTCATGFFVAGIWGVVRTCALYEQKRQVSAFGNAAVALVVMALFLDMLVRMLKAGPV